MTREEIKEKVLHGLKKQFGSTFENQTITDATSLVDDFSADSLDLVELTMDIEDTFDIKIPDRDEDKLRTVGDVIEYIVLKKGG